MTDKTLKVIPLGGLGAIGKNMMVLEYDEALLVVDAGLMFPDDEMLGIDLVLPDFSYVVENKRPGARHRPHPRPRGPRGRPALPAQGGRHARSTAPGSPWGW